MHIWNAAVREVQLVKKDNGIVQCIQKAKTKCFVQNVPPERFGDNICKRPTKGRRSCSPPLEMLSHFSPLAPFFEKKEISPLASGDKGGAAPLDPLQAFEKA